MNGLSIKKYQGRKFLDSHSFINRIYNDLTMYASIDWCVHNDVFKFYRKSRLVKFETSILLKSHTFLQFHLTMAKSWAYKYIVYLYGIMVPSILHARGAKIFKRIGFFVLGYQHVILPTIFFYKAKCY